jgi:hypothetical protein
MNSGLAECPPPGAGVHAWLLSEATAAATDGLSSQDAMRIMRGEHVAPAVAERR